MMKQVQEAEEVSRGWSVAGPLVMQRASTSLTLIIKPPKKEGVLTAF